MSKHITLAIICQAEHLELVGIRVSTSEGVSSRCFCIATLYENMHFQKNSFPLCFSDLVLAQENRFMFFCCQRLHSQACLVSVSRIVAFCACYSGLQGKKFK